MNVTIERTPFIDRFDDLMPLITYAFRPSPQRPPDGDERRGWSEVSAGTEAFVLREDGHPQAMAITLPMDQNVRGPLYPACGIWAVATLPSGRRKGYARQIVGALLEGVRQDGCVFSTLYPFRESFYERMGYVGFPQPRKARFSPTPLSPLLKADLPGRVDLLSAEDGFDTYRAFLRDCRATTHGMGVSNSPWREAWHRVRNSAWIALARDENEQVTGVMVYKLEGHEGSFIMQVMAFYTTTLAGRYLLLEWIARHIDQATSVEIYLPPFELPETWLPDLKVEASSGFAPMGRVLDVARMGGMQTGPGGFSARLHDPLCPWNEGVYRFESSGGALCVEPARQPDCDLTIQALAALAFGPHDPAVFSFRGWGDPSPAVQTAMRNMFPPRLPYLHEQF